MTDHTECAAREAVLIEALAHQQACATCAERWDDCVDGRFARALLENPSPAASALLAELAALRQSEDVLRGLYLWLGPRDPQTQAVRPPAYVANADDVLFDQFQPTWGPRWREWFRNVARALSALDAAKGGA